MSQPLYIVGTGGLAREVAHLVRMIDPANERWDLQGFITHTPDEIGEDLVFARVTETDDSFLAKDMEVAVAIGLGFPRVRAAAARRYVDEGASLTFPNLVSPNSTYDETVTDVGQGNVFCAGLISTQVSVGDFNYFNWYATVGHDCVIGSFNVINPSANLSGGARLGDEILVGTGAQLLEGVAVGDRATVGAGAVCTKDVAADVVVAGIPAKPLSR